MTNAAIEIPVVDLFTEVLSNLPVFETLVEEDVPTSTLFNLYTYNAVQTGGSISECDTSLVEISESQDGKQIFSCTVIETMEPGEGYAMIHGKHYSLQDAVYYAELAMSDFRDHNVVECDLMNLEFDAERYIQTLSGVQTSASNISVEVLAERLAEVQRQLNIVNNVRLLRNLK